MNCIQIFWVSLTVVWLASCAPSPQISPEITPPQTLSTKMRQNHVGDQEKVINTKPLTFDDTSSSGIELKNQIDSLDGSAELKNQMVLLGWTDTAEIVIRPGTEGSPLPGQLPTPTPGPDSQWAISPETGKVSSAIDWQQYIWSSEQKQLSQRLGATQAKYLEIPSPDGKKVAVSQFGQKLLVYDVNEADQSPLSLPPSVPKEPDILAYITPVWSMDGSKLAYVAATKQNASEITGIQNIYPEAHPYLQLFQIHIYDFSKHSLIKLNLPYVSYSPTSLAISPDNRFLAFITPPERQAHPHLFVTNLDNLTQNDLTPDWKNSHPEYFWPNAIFWSPLGDRIAYGDTATGIIFVMSLEPQ